MKPTLNLLMTGVFIFVSCAKETSEEERKREQTDRERDRLKKAVGSYFGYVTIDDNKIVPLSLDLSINLNPQEGTDNPTLAGALRIGMFGGVVLSSDQTSYDAGNGRISVNLSKKSSQSGGAAAVAGNAGAPLELHGFIRDGKLVDGSLEGPHSGSRKVTLTDGGQNLFSEQVSFNYSTQISDAQTVGSLTPNAQLSLKRSTIQRPSILSSSDLPQLPGLEASFRFKSLGVSPQPASDVLYEPIKGFIDMQFAQNMTIRVENIYLTNDVLNTSLTDWRPAKESAGVLIKGSAISGHVRFGSSFPGLGLESPENADGKPPQYFAGTYQPLGSPTVFRSIASLEYQFSQGTNSAEYPFPVFPKFQLRLKICSGAQVVKEGTYELSALDQVKGIGRFIDSRPGQKSLIDIQYNENWTSLSGKYSDGNTGPIDTSNPQLYLFASSTPIANCAQAEK